MTSPVTSPPLSSPVPGPTGDNRGVRTGAALGIAAIALIVAGFALLAAQETTLRAPADMVAGFYADASLVRIFAGGLLECAGFVLLLPFAVALTQRLRGDGSGGRLLPDTARSAATVYVTLCLAPGMSSGGAALWLAHTGGADPAVIQALNLLRVFSYFAALLPFAAFLVAVGIAAVTSGRLPRWAGWSAIAIGAALAATVPVAASDATNLLALLGLLWIVPVAVHLLRSPDPATRG